MSKIILAFGGFLAIITCVIQTPSAQTNNDKAAAGPPAATSESSKVPTILSGSSDQSSNSDRAKSEAKRYYKTGVKYGRANLFEQAAASFLLAIRLKPDYGDAYYGLGHAYFDLKRWKESIEALEQAVRINPKDTEAYAMLGEAYSMLHRDTGALSPAGNDSPAGENVGLTSSSFSSSKTAAKSHAENRALTTIYRVGIGDVLDVRLGETPADQQTFFTVSASGLLEHPILSQPLRVVGLTTEDIGRQIETDLRRRAVNEKAQVLVGVREYSSHTILVSGLVKDPGTKVLRREAIPLYVVIADAQPLPEAGRATVKSHQKSEAVVVDITDARAMDMLVHSGDVITLERSPAQFFYVGGEVKVPGEKTFRRGMTLTQAILSAGGVTKKGKMAELGRERAGALLGVTRYKLKEIYSGKSLDPEIHPGDRITVNQ